MILNLVIYSAVLLLGIICLVIAMRCFGRTQIPLGSRTLALERPLGAGGERFTPAMGLAAIVWGVGVIGAIYGVSAIYRGIFNDGLSWDGMFSIWNRWDAQHYLELAEFGYHNYTDAEHLFLVFFPLYPWLAHLLGLLISNYALAGHLLSSLCFVGSCYVLARMVTEEFGRRTAALALAMLSAFPYAFFFAGYYTESLFLFTSLLTFYCIRRHRYLSAGIFGALAALTRMQGILLAAAALVEYGTTEHPLRKLRERDWSALLRSYRKLACIALMAAGPIVYLWLNYSVEGNPFQFTIYQRENWYQGFLILPECLRVIWSESMVKFGTHSWFAIWGPEFWLFFVYLAIVCYGSRRLPPAWITYFMLALVLNYSLSFPLSIGRYMSTAFPMPVTLALATRNKPQLANFILAACALFQGLLLVAYLAGKRVY